MMKTMIKACFRIYNGYKYEYNYEALFEDVNDMEDFIEDCKKYDDGEIELLEYYDVTVQDILEDKDFEEGYKIEMLAVLLLPAEMRKNATFKELERALMLEGVLPF